jgi:hypothetical protein
MVTVGRDGCYRVGRLSEYHAIRTRERAEVVIERVVPFYDDDDVLDRAAFLRNAPRSQAHACAPS